MKKISMVIFMAICFLPNAFPFSPGHDYDKNFRELADSTRSRYGIVLSVPKKYSATAYEGTRPFSLGFALSSTKYGSIFNDFSANLKSDDGNCVILIESLPNYDVRRIDGEKKDPTWYLRRELSYCFGEGVLARNNDPILIKLYGNQLTKIKSSIARKRCNADSVLFYTVPDGKWTFCYSFPAEIHPFQYVCQKNYPVLQRYFFFKKGHLTFSVLVLLSKKGAKHQNKYVKDLCRMARFEEQ